TATAMYHSTRNPLRKITRDSEKVDIVKGEKRRRLHKAFLRYHDPNNWPLLREALKSMGRADLIGNGKQHLIPSWQPLTNGTYQSPRRANSTQAPAQAQGRASIQGGTSNGLRKPGQTPRKGLLLTQHTGLPPRQKG
ncbi:MAG: DUF3362 domain-containing protein, partial [Limnohabitans sp.]